MTSEDVISELHTDAACGLTRKAARSRSKKSGKNTLFDERSEIYAKEIRKLLLTDAALWIFSAVSVLTLCFSEVAVGIPVLLCALVAAVLFGYFFQAEKVMKLQLAEYRIPWVSVIRGGKRIQVSARELVPGDVLLLKSGDIVPCDCRILSQQNLRVLTLFPNEQGQAQWKESLKRSDYVYSFGEDEVPPNYVNMLFGGSKLVQGEVAAVAVAIGKDTFLGAMQLFSVPAEVHSDGKERGSALQPFLKIYGILMLLLLFPLTLIGIWLLPERESVLSLFAALSAMLGAASPAVLELYFRMVSFHTGKENFQKHPKENRVIFKSPRAWNRLSSVSDIFVLGKCGCSDGKPHLCRAMIGKGEVPLRERDGGSEELQPLCEAFLLLSTAISKELEKDFLLSRTDDSVFCKELVTASDFDVEALRVRIQQVTLLSEPHEKCKMLEVQSRTGAYRLRFSEEKDFWTLCAAYETGGMLHAMDASATERFRAFYYSAHAVGCRVVTAVRDSNGRKTLLGALAIREQFQKTLPSVIEELKQSGVRTTFFFRQEDARTKLELQSIGLWDRAVCKSECVQLGRSAEECFSRFRVFVGFSEKEILNLLRDLRTKGSRVAVMGLAAGDEVLLQHATLSVACDDTEYHSRALESGILEDASEDGCAESNRCSQSIRRSSDVLLERANRFGGGLLSLSMAISDSRAARVRMRFLLFPALLTSQFLCVFLTVFSVCFGGIGRMNAFQILMGDLLLPMMFLLTVLTVPIPQSNLRKWISFDAAAIEKTITEKAFWIPLLGATFGSVFYCFLLRCFGLLSEESASSFLFVSYLVLQLLLFIERSVRQRIPLLHRAWRSVRCYFAAVILLIGSSVLFAPVASVTGLGGWSLLTVCSLPLMPLLFYGIRIFVKHFSHRTDKNEHIL